MKNLKLLFVLIACITFTGLQAQTDNKQEAKQTKINKFSIESTQGTINYTVKVETKATDYVKMDDLSKKEQTRVKSANNVVTTIEVDNDVDPSYDNKIFLTYQSSEDDTVKVIPTASGFNIMVAGEELKYDFLKEVCNSREGCPVAVKVVSNE